MSGIIGSRLNIRGSGLVGGLGSDGQVLTSAGAGQEIVFESVSSAAVSALNNATANELVTVGSTTTELDAESGLTYTDGALVIGGTTPSLTIGDAGAEDTKIIFDGNAQDFHIGLDDTADDLVIGLGTALGTTPAIAIDENLKVNIPVTTASTSTSTGSLTTGGGAGIGADLYVGDDAYLITDSAVLGFGADKDTLLTHTDGTGLTLNSTNKLCFNDASQFVQGSSATVLSIGATDEIDLTATAVDLNGTLNVSGVATFQATPVFPDGSLALADLDIDGGTDIGAAIVDADLFIVDDGAGGTNRKVTASRLKTYAGGASVLGDLTDVSMDATNFTDSLLIQTNSDGSAPGTGTLSSANDNIGIGKNAFAALTSAVDNVVLGNLAGAALTSAARCILIGSDAGNDLTTATDAIFIGHGAGDGHDTEVRNIGIGLNALGGVVAGGEYNICIGGQAGATNTTGDKNIIIGDTAGGDNTTGSAGVFIGYDAGGNNTTGYGNIYIGLDAGDANTEGGGNIGIGINTVGQSDTENTNYGIGYGSLQGAIAGGEQNTAYGYYGFKDLTSADDGVAIGYEAGKATTTGGHNTFVGFQAGAQSTTGVGNTIVGYGCDVLAVDTGPTQVFGYNISGAANDFTFGKASNVVSNDFDADADWSRSSDLRLKRNIQDSTLGLDFINDLRPIKFQWKPSNEVPKEMKSEYNEENQKNLDITSHGFIAQEVKEAIDKHGDTTFGGWHLDKIDNETQRVKKNMFVMPLIRAVQELSAQVTTLQDEIKTLKGG